MTLAAMPALDAHGADDLAVDEPVLLDVDGLERATSVSRPRTSSWIAFTPVHGRAECALSPWNVTLRLQVAEAAGVEDAVGRLEHDDEPGAVEERRCRRAPAAGSRRPAPPRA